LQIIISDTKYLYSTPLNTTDEPLDGRMCGASICA